MTTRTPLDDEITPMLGLSGRPFQARGHEWEVIPRPDLHLVTVFCELGDFESLAVRLDTETSTYRWECYRSLWVRCASGPCESFDDGMRLAAAHLREAHR